MFEPGALRRITVAVIVGSTTVILLGITIISLLQGGWMIVR